MATVRLIASSSQQVASINSQILLAKHSKPVTQIPYSRIQVRCSATDPSPINGHRSASREAQAAKDAMEMLWLKHDGLHQSDGSQLSASGGRFDYDDEGEDGSEAGYGRGADGGFTAESARSLLEELELEAEEESKQALSIVDRVLWVDKRVRDYMTANPICLHRDMSLRDAAQIFLRYRISGAPVVEAYEEEDGVGLGKVVGVLSQRDIMWKELKTHNMAEEEFLRRLANYQDQLNQGPRVEKLRQHLRKAASLRVEESMTDTVLQVEEDSFMVDATEIMLNCNVSRLPVVARLPDGRKTLIGIITCSDILRHTLLLL
ncbi:hypothetical protein CLOM_g9099 [Closterium sp. NIES-68]|nr:hypothetical protein CLOM_g21018 [Closterium sp. NIES-68]GJP49940.1 hypothetical protein CLOM_g9099 [Closterium sp. NIES-68]GJP60813.1 hypothetical protein CLOP_g18031 [Closterium sp. NIES-67]